MYFSLKNNQFLYDKTATSDVIIEITNEQQSELIQAISENRHIDYIDNKFIYSEPQPTPYHEFTGGKWTLSDERKAEQLKRAKAAKLSEINAKSVAVVDGIVKEQIPTFEMQTWNAQSAEAKAFKKDETAPTPTLDLIALNRGIDRILLIKKAYKKATALEQATAAIVGQRQALQDKVEQAKSLADLEKIEVTFKL